MIKYRADIDGLRALAVAVVILFHLGFQPLEGGFIGVDVFFVISGFLITQIIEGQIGKGGFSLKHFYVRRIRRLIPAMLVTVITTFVAATFILAPEDFIGFAKSCIGAAFSVSNFVFLAEAGYWDTASELKPLLHTWSLGVEEQFYLIWPALLILIHRFVSFDQRWIVYLALTVFGVWFSAFGLQSNPSAAFYLTPFRIFEFSMGALIAHVSYMRVWKRLSENVLICEGLFIAGFSMIIFCVLVYKGTTPFPGYNAVLPCAGTVLILLSGASEQQQGPLGSLVLCNPVSRWLGQISYSAYLVHWPIIAFYRYELHQEPNLAAQILMGGLTILLAALLYYQVEKRFWIKSSGQSANKARLPARQFIGIIGAFSLVLSAISAHAITNDGWQWRAKNAAFTAEEIEAGKSKRFVHLRDTCRIVNFPDGPNCRSDAAINVVVIGNSHEPDGLNFLQAGYGDKLDIQFIYFGSTNRCDLSKDTQGVWRANAEACKDRMDKLYEAEIIKKVDYLVYAANQPFSVNKQAFLDILRNRKLQNPVIKIIVFGGYVNTKVECVRLINETGRFDECFKQDNINYFESDPTSQTLYSDFMSVSDTYIDRVALLCPDRQLTKCTAQTPGGIPAFYDGHHLSLEFAEWSGRLYAEQFPDLFAE